MINTSTPAVPAILKYIKAHIEEQDGCPQKVTTINLKNCLVQKVCYLPLLPNLMIVDLRNNRLFEMTGFQACFNITQLHLCENYISKIKRINHLQKLKMIDLRGNFIRDINSSITNLPQSVTQLKLRCNEITNIQQISKIDNKFEVIWLQQNQFIRTSKQYYKKMLGLKGIQNLHDFWI